MKLKYDKLFLVLSIIIGVVLGFVLELFYQNFFPMGSRVLFVTAYIVLYSLAFGIVLLIKGMTNGTFVNFGKIILLTLLSFVVLTGCTALFEYIYEMNINVVKTKYSDMQYVFIIDDSGSMKTIPGYSQVGNDPGLKRYDAVEEIINSLDSTNKFAVYKFDNETRCVTPFGTQESKTYKLDRYINDEDCGTFMMTAISTALNDVPLSQSVHTKVIVLTDGQPMDDEMYNDIITKCQDNNVSISSVGFGAPDSAFLTRMANDTGGTYVLVNDLSSLSEDVGTVVRTNNGEEVDRDLIGKRYDSKETSVLYAFLRIIFLILLGVLWTIFKMLLVGEKKYTKKALVISIVLCSVAGILCELLMLPYMIPSSLVRILFCALWAVTLVPTVDYNAASLGNDALHNINSDYQKGIGIANDWNSKPQGGGNGSKSFL